MRARAWPTARRAAIVAIACIAVVFITRHRRHARPPGMQRPHAVSPRRPSTPPAPPPAPPPPPPTPPDDGFVHVRDGGLVHRGRALRCVGADAFHLQESAARELLRMPTARGLTVRTLDAASRMGLCALRIGGFNDGPRDRVAIQRRRGELDARGIAGLDRVVTLARERHLLLILSLSNMWNDYGGARQYLRWRHLPEGERWRMFTDAGVRDDLVAYARALVTHRNPLTGIRYCDDATIMAWEVMNEPRGDGLIDGGEAVTALLTAVGRALHEAAPRQLVLAGEEGFDADFAPWETTWTREAALGWLGPARHESASALMASPVFDAATVHLYPAAWGVPSADVAAWGERWITSHAAVAARYGKPLLVTEMGLRNRRERAVVLGRWLQVARETPGVAMAMPWGLVVRGLPGRDDGFRWREGDDLGAVVAREAAAWRQ